MKSNRTQAKLLWFERIKLFYSFSFIRRQREMGRNRSDSDQIFISTDIYFTSDVNFDGFDSVHWTISNVRLAFAIWLVLHCIRIAAHVKHWVLAIHFNSVPSNWSVQNCRGAHLMRKKANPKSEKSHFLCFSNEFVSPFVFCWTKSRHKWQFGSRGAEVLLVH